MARTPRIPKYRRHSSGQARVTINGKDHLLGPYGSASSEEAYRRIIAEWLANPAKQAADANDNDTLTISALVVAYWKFACKHYDFDPKHRRGDFYCLRGALKVVRSLYGHTLAKEFGPLVLKACRQKMIAMEWSRKYVNAQIDRIRLMFRWATEEELLAGSIHQDLRAVPCLRYGKSGARETKTGWPDSRSPAAHATNRPGHGPPPAAGRLPSRRNLRSSPDRS